MYDFYTKLAQIINAGKSNSIVIAGNVYDLFYDGTAYVPLVPFLLSKTAPSKRIQLVYELNGPIRVSDSSRVKLAAGWAKWKAKIGAAVQAKTFSQQFREALNGTSEKGDEFSTHMNTAIGNATFALEFLRQLCFCSREILDEDLLIFIEAADMIVPTGNGDVASLNDAQLRRVAIMQDWFCDPAFINSRDAVCLVAESKSLIHPRVSRLPQVVHITVPSPTLEVRGHFIAEYCKGPVDACPTCHQKVHAEDCPGALQWDAKEQQRAAAMTAGLSIHALRQLLAEAAYLKQPLTNDAISEAVEDFIQSQVGDDVVEFSRPHHKLDAVIGAAGLVKFIKKELIPRFTNGTLSGCAVGGPIGGGKTYIFEAVAAELDMPVMLLKNLRSQWFGQTDVIFERLKRATEALDRVCIFLDEADTQFGGVGADTHETERRLTGKVQQMMSDPRLKGKVIWLLMTARINCLSPDIRRPGRAGDLIVPVLDPVGKDREDFVRWTLQPVAKKVDALKQGDHPADYGDEMEALVGKLVKCLDSSYSAASFAALRAHLESNYADFIEGHTTITDVIMALVNDLIPPSIGGTREYQTLQALMNCTRRSLLPDELMSVRGDLKKSREAWESRIRELEAKGIR